MIRWLIRTLILALIVAGVMVVYLSPSLRTRTQSWLVDQKELIEKRIAQTQKLLKKTTQKGSKEAEAKIKKGQKEIKEIKEQSKELVDLPKNPPMEKPVKEKDKKELEKILEEHSK